MKRKQAMHRMNDFKIEKKHEDLKKYQAFQILFIDLFQTIQVRSIIRTRKVP